ncbi:hypothetical protein [Neptunicella marina]|uniref:Uncharacterized protein n=1 Tax=Neptunicella marina TaxID=2125989 RepID=A0A8J6IU99_9ALTE|nr:hypothetical protein [Neptunicella marina]MBC3766369.1 hypothetical protein [Neptunicella marina]
MKKYLSILFLLLSFNSYANESIFTNIKPLQVMDFLHSGIPNKVPALYVWDKKGQPQYFHSGNGFDKIPKNINLESAIPNTTQSGFIFLKKYLTSNKLWNKNKNNVVFVIFDKSVGNCQSCDTAQNTFSHSNPFSSADYNLIKLVIVQ